MNTERTTFTLDVLGSYVANTWQEALDSTDPVRHLGARPFDVVVIGGGTFGAAFAQHLFSSDKTHAHRILVLEAGPLSLPEHVQNLPMIGLGVPAPTSLADLRAAGMDGRARAEVWGLAWHGDQKYPGLAYTLAGRSLFWGGWSPQLLDTELASWPPAVKQDLQTTYFAKAAEQIGVRESNDFLTGPLHTALRSRVYTALKGGAVSEAVPFAELPELVQPPEGTPANEREIWKLEAPLGVQTRTRPGFFPFNKFSALPLLVKAARAALVESELDDARKRLMVVPNCHVKRLLTEPAGASGGPGARVTAIETNFGTLSLPAHGKVFLATGTIECARLARLSFAEGPLGPVPGAERMGQGLMAHLRSNLTIRVPREAFAIAPAKPELSTSALFVKGRHTHTDGTLGHFHLQVTASGLGHAGTDSEAELFKKVPDLDGMEAFANASDTHVVLTLRGIGEMTAGNPDSAITLDPETDEWGVRRAFVRLATSAKDRALWDAMDAAALELAEALGGTHGYEVLGKNRDGLGTTHHESGGLAMGTDPATSVTDPDGRFHAVANAYVLGPALFPTIGSPNPMLTGIALLRRTVARVFPVAAAQAEPGFESLFDGTQASFARWKSVGAGGFDLVDGALVARPGGDLGLLYLPGRRFGDFTLRMEVRFAGFDDNSGVFVRFRDPSKPVPDPAAPGGGWTYANPAWVPVTTGFEVQLDERARPDGADEHRTGAIYGIPIGSAAGEQEFQRAPALAPGLWHELEVRVQADAYEVRIRAVGAPAAMRVTRFVNGDPKRGRAPGADPDSGYVGFQAHTGRVAFRRVRIQAANVASAAIEDLETREVIPQRSPQPEPTATRPESRKGSPKSGR